MQTLRFLHSQKRVLRPRQRSALRPSESKSSPGADALALSLSERPLQSVHLSSLLRTSNLDRLRLMEQDYEEWLV